MILIAEAGREIPRRIAQVLLANLGEEIEAVSDPNLNLEIPTSKNTFLLGEFNDQMIYSSTCALVVEQFQRSTLQDFQSGSSSLGKAFLLTPIRVRIVWCQDAYPSYHDSILGRDLTHPEYYQYVAELYKGAILNCIYKLAPSEFIAIKVELTSTYAGVDLLRESMRGVALTEWLVTSEVSIPLPSRFRDPNAAI